ncbi:unnamed protein product [Absidia cylindrospora]
MASVQPMKYQYLISRTGDIVFSLAVGTMAYFVNERDNPKAQNGKSVMELMNRKRQRTIDLREQRKLEKQSASHQDQE